MNKTIGILPIFISLNSFAIDYVDNSIKDKDNLKIVSQKFLEESGFHSSSVDKVIATDIENIVLIKLNPEVINSDNLYVSYLINENIVSIGNLLKKDKYNRFYDVNTKYINKVNVDYVNEYLDLNIDKDKTIDYISDNEKTTIYVFTDTTCPYCYKYSKEIKSLNDSGVSVRHIPYSRSYSPNNEEKNQGDSYFQLSNIICSNEKDKLFNFYFEKTINRVDSDAFNEYNKINENERELCSEIVKNGYILGKNLDVRGTPATMLSNGEMISGYLSSDKILNIIKINGIIK